MVALEALLATREELHRKRLDEGRRRVAKLEREIAIKAQQNAEVSDDDDEIVLLAVLGCCQAGCRCGTRG